MFGEGSGNTGSIYIKLDHATEQSNGGGKEIIRWRACVNIIRLKSSGEQGQIIHKGVGGERNRFGAMNSGAFHC